MSERLVEPRLLVLIQPKAIKFVSLKRDTVLQKWREQEREKGSKEMDERGERRIKKEGEKLLFYEPTALENVTYPKSKWLLYLNLLTRWEFAATVYGKVCMRVLLNFAALFYIHSCYKISKCFAGDIRIFELFTQMVL